MNGRRSVNERLSRGLIDHLITLVYIIMMVPTACRQLPQNLAIHVVYPTDNSLMLATVLVLHHTPARLPRD